MSAIDFIQGSLLCLKCRGAGHIVNDCPSQQWFPGDGWFFSEARRHLDFGSHGNKSQDLCARCQNLDVLQLLRNDIPWQHTYDLNNKSVIESAFVKNLGKTGTIQFLSECGLCCCLFAMAANPASADQDVLMLPFWTMSRLAGEDDLFIDKVAMQRRFAKCLMVVLHDKSDKSIELPFSTVSHRGDAICIVEEDLYPGEMLGGRVINPHNLSIDIINQWITCCSQLHQVECSPEWTKDLENIRLIDVNVDKREVVQYPYRGCEYIALSYVWGEVKQGNFQLGSRIPEKSLPQTIEDAMEFCRQMGKRYLWVDSVCIDQSDEEQKSSQIKIMKNIYRGSYITLIALSAKSANEGLPKIHSPEQIFPQISCCVNGKRLVGLMPTLSHQIWRRTWGKRAWTLQEALLSPRCLYISDHQLQYECNGIQCSESLDETKSFTHQLRNDEVDTTHALWRHERVGAGCLRNITSRPTHRLTHYNRKLILYKYRSMRYDADAINAFLGILQHLEVFYTKGFIQGLPIEHLQWGLLWRARLSNPLRCEEFPSWSWAGWKGAIWPGGPFDEIHPDQFPVHVQIWRALKDGSLEQIFKTPKDGEKESPNHDFVFHNDPVTKASTLAPENGVFDEKLYPEGFLKDYLFIEAITFNFTADYTVAHPISGEDGYFVNFIGAAKCFIRISRTDFEIQNAPKQQYFLLLGRDKGNGYVYHYLLVLKYQQDAAIATRGTVITLLVPENKLEVLEELEPSKQRVVLA